MGHKEQIQPPAWGLSGNAAACAVGILGNAAPQPAYGPGGNVLNVGEMMAAAREQRHVMLHTAITVTLDGVLRSAVNLLVDIKGETTEADEKPNCPSVSLQYVLADGANIVRRRCEQINAVLDEIRSILF